MQGEFFLMYRRIVRDQAFKSLDMYKQRIEAYASTLVRYTISECSGILTFFLPLQPETALLPDGGPANGVTFASSSGQGDLVSSAAGAAGALASWAFSSVSSRVSPQANAVSFDLSKSTFSWPQLTSLRRWHLRHRSQVPSPLHLALYHLYPPRSPQRCLPPQVLPLLVTPRVKA